MPVHRRRPAPTRQAAVPSMVAVLAIAAGCAGPSSTEEPSVTSSEPAATASSAGTGEVAELTATGAPLEPGLYTRAGFEPAITLELDGSWQAVQLFSGFFDVQQDPGSADVIAVQFARPTAVFGAEGASTPATAEDAVAQVSANPNLAVVETSDSRIGGLDGSQVTVENAGGAHAQILTVPPGPLGIDPGRRLWIAFFDTNDGLLAIMIGGSTARWDEALAAAEPVLESVRIGQ